MLQIFAQLGTMDFVVFSEIPGIAMSDQQSRPLRSSTNSVLGSSDVVQEKTIFETSGRRTGTC